MDDLLTARQVQDLLKVDRITVYRMLQDGRLKGVKIGQQWRFHRREVDRLLGSGGEAAGPAQPAGDGSFPTHCVQTIQDLFAEVGQVSALVLDGQGRVLTRASRPGALYQALVETAAGQEAYRACWREFAQAGLAGSKFFTCPAGLQYVAAPIHDRDEPAELFLAGQFYWQAPDPREEAERVRRLAETCHLPLEALQRAAAAVPVIDPAQHARVESWPFLAARAVESILNERTGFIERLQRIANLTQLT
jgi:excisionase family DNA binding protein